MFLNINNKVNITFCGMMGSGKSFIGKIIANKIKYDFVDIDRLIEKKEKKTITTIFQENGENYFRNLEEDITIKSLQKENTVISLGGGSIVNKNIRNCIKNNSYNIYLKVNTNILKKRLINSKNRPLILNNNLNKTLSELIEKREIYYKEADLIIKNDTNSSFVLRNILKKITNE